MSQPRRGWTDEQVEQVVGNLLRFGVITAAAVVLLGGILYLLQNGRARVDLGHLPEEPSDLRSPVGIVQDAVALQSRGIIQLGLLLLVLTPIARVTFSIYAFARQRDWTYVVVTVIVLAVLLYSLFSGHG
ncbi:MAG TPA: DUF1634 domain-containing protein [Gemmataceae bacterium]|jgi:uncharacterized membrane protein|nr:DUF1634 domain-containing protein [Gemmataceae bacterium]